MENTIEQTKNIEIGLYDGKTGDIVETVSLYDLIITGDSYEIQLRNFGNLGLSDYELVVENEKQIIEKIRLGHLEYQTNNTEQQEKEGALQ